MRAGRAFISYRRDDTSGYAGRIYDRLQRRFPGQIFMDVTDIRAGVDYVELIEREVRISSVLVALIGRHWLDGNRLQDTDDLVNREIALALKNDVSVIPVLLRGAHMPSVSELPEDLKGLARKNAVEVGETTFDRDAEALIRALEPKLGNKKLRRRLLAATASLVLLVGIAVGVYIKNRPHAQLALDTTSGSTGNPAQPGPEKTSSTGNPAIDELKKAFGNFQVPVSGTSGTNNRANTGEATSPPFEFDPVGRWSVAANGTASGVMLLNLKNDRNYEITNASGYLGAFAQSLGSNGTWTFNTIDKRLVLLPTNFGYALGIRITGKKQGSFSAASVGNDGVFYTFTRQ